MLVFVFEENENDIIGRQLNRYTFETVQERDTPIAYKIAIIIIAPARFSIISDFFINPIKDKTFRHFPYIDFCKCFGFHDLNFVS